MIDPQAARDAAANPLLTQIAWSSVIVFLLQTLKKASWFPWLTEQSKNVSRVLAAVASFAAGVGIHTVWNGSDRTFTIALPTLAGFLGLLFAWLKSHCIQEGVYRLYQKSESAGIDPELLKQAVRSALDSALQPSKTSAASSGN